jgi:hypothetical protein
MLSSEVENSFRATLGECDASPILGFSGLKRLKTVDS